MVDWGGIIGGAVGGLLGLKKGSSSSTTQLTPAPQTQFQMDLESSFRDWLFGSLSSEDKVRQLQTKKQSLMAQRQALVRYAGTVGYSDQSVGFGPDGDPDIGGGNPIGDDIGSAIGLGSISGADFGMGETGGNIGDLGEWGR